MSEPTTTVQVYVSDWKRIHGYKKGPREKVRDVVKRLLDDLEREQ